MLVGALKAVQCTSISHQQCLIAEWLELNVTVRVRVRARVRARAREWNFSSD